MLLFLLYMLEVTGKKSFNAMSRTNVENNPMTQESISFHSFIPMVLSLAQHIFYIILLTDTNHQTAWGRNKIKDDPSLAKETMGYFYSLIPYVMVNVIIC